MKTSTLFAATTALCYLALVTGTRILPPYYIPDGVLQTSECLSPTDEYVTVCLIEKAGVNVLLNVNGITDPRFCSHCYSAILQYADTCFDKYTEAERDVFLKPLYENCDENCFGNTDTTRAASECILKVDSASDDGTTGGDFCDDCRNVLVNYANDCLSLLVDDTVLQNHLDYIYSVCPVPQTKG